MAIARLKDDMLTAEMNRRLIQENTSLATQQVIAQSMETKRKQAEHLVKSNAGPVIGKILDASDGLEKAVVDPTSEAPVVVEPAAISGGGFGSTPERLVPTYSTEAPEIISDFPGRPAGPILPMPSETMSAYTPGVFPGRPAGPILPMPTEMAALPAYTPGVFPGRPAGPLLPMPGDGSLEPLDVLPPEPVIRARPEGPALAVTNQAPVSAFPVRPAGPLLPQPHEPGPVVGSGPIVYNGRPLIGGGGDPTQPLDTGPGWMETLRRSLGDDWLDRATAPGAAPSSFPPRPSGPLAPMPVSPEAPVPVEWLEQPPLRQTGAPIEAPIPVEQPVTAGPFPARPDYLPQPNAEVPLPPPAAVGPFPARPGVLPQPNAEVPLPPPAAVGPFPPRPEGPPPQPGPEAPLPIEPLAEPGAPVPSTAPPAMPEPTSIAAKVAEGTPAPDGGTDHQTVDGPVHLTPEEKNILGQLIAFGADPSGQTGKFASILKTIYDPSVTLTPNQKVSSLAGREPVGTPEDVAAKIAVENAKPAKLDEGIVEVDKRKYQVKVDAKGEKYLELIPGQPEAAAASPFGTGDFGGATRLHEQAGHRQAGPGDVDAAGAPELRDHGERQLQVRCQGYRQRQDRLCRR